MKSGNCTRTFEDKVQHIRLHVIESKTSDSQIRASELRLNERDLAPILDLFWISVALVTIDPSACFQAGNRWLLVTFAALSMASNTFSCCCIVLLMRIANDERIESSTWAFVSTKNVRGPREDCCCTSFSNGRTGHENWVGVDDQVLLYRYVLRTEISKWLKSELRLD